MAPILREMERQVVEEVSGVGVEFPSYVDDLHCGLYVRGRSVRGLDAVGRKERMEDLLDKVSRTIKEVAGEGVCLLRRIKRTISSFAIRQGVQGSV